MLLYLLIVTSSSLDLRIVSSSHQNQCHHSRINSRTNHYFLSALLADPEVDSCLLVSWTLAGVLVSHLTIYGKYNCTYVLMIQ